MAIRGWIYIITNKAMPGLLKIGYSTKDPELRANELGNTGSPHPYFVEYDALVSDPHSIEQKIHRALASKKEGKEWFRCEVDETIYEIRKILNAGIILEKTNRQFSINCSRCSEKAFTKDTDYEVYYCKKHYEELLEESSLLEKINNTYKSKNRLKSDKHNSYKRILIVEDEENLINLEEMVITEKFPDYKIEKAHDGEEGLAKVRTFLPDLLITNIGMPKISGFQMLDILHRGKKDIPTIITSGFINIEVLKFILDYQQSWQSELMALRKPFKSNDLIQTVKEMIDRSK